MLFLIIDEWPSPLPRDAWESQGTHRDAAGWDGQSLTIVWEHDIKVLQRL